MLEQPLRMELPRSVDVALAALGGDLKCRPATAQGSAALVWPEIGDLEDPARQDALEDFIEAQAPGLLVCDAHPGYFSSQLAGRISVERGLPLLAVQHHRAHIAAVCLELGLYDEPVIGLAFDGTGYGDDGTAWGGEFFSGSLAAGLTRCGSFAALPLPGGDAAVRQPWRSAAALLLKRGADEETIKRWLEQRGVALSDPGLFLRGLKSGAAVGRSSALGRWFDAVSALLGIRVVAEFEAQPAIELQKLAESAGAEAAAADWPYRIEPDQHGLLRIDFPGLLDAAWAGPEQAAGLAHAFHRAAAEAAARLALDQAGRIEATRVLCAGGCFLNRLFERLLRERIEAVGLQCLRSRSLPPGDQAVALGQIGLALARCDA